jgi:hypothetical protein
MKDMVQGISFNPLFTMDLSGPANGKPGYWAWDYKNIAPRISMAYSPGYKDGLLGSLFGGPGKPQSVGALASTTITSARALSIHTTARARLASFLPVHFRRVL